MSAFYVYSFEDTTVTISHPEVGTYSAFGKGIGSLNVTLSNDVTFHDTAADLAVVVSRSAKKNGVLQFDILQTSDFNTWLKKYYNYVITAAPSSFAAATVIIKNSATGDSWTATGVSPQKIPDSNYQAQAQNRQWSLMAAHIDMT